MAEHEHNKDETKQRILSAALREFGECGYQSASTNRICREAKISKGSLFHHFGSKEMLFGAVLRQCLLDFRGFVSAEEEGADAVSQFYRRRMRFFSEHPDHYAVIMSLFDGTAGRLCPLREEREWFEREKERFLEDRLSGCLLRENVERADAVELIAAMSAYLQDKYLRGAAGAGEPPERLMEAFMQDYDHMLSMLLHGILQESSPATGATGA